jgi:hypothetical protein
MAMAIRQRIGERLMAVAAVGIVTLGAAATATYVPFHHVPPVPNPSQPSRFGIPGKPMAGNEGRTRPASTVLPSPPPPQAIR